MAVLTVQLKRVTGNKEREGVSLLAWVPSACHQKGPRPGVKPGSTAERQHMGRPLYPLS